MKVCQAMKEVGGEKKEERNMTEKGGMIRRKSLKKKKEHEYMREKKKSIFPCLFYYRLFSHCVYMLRTRQLKKTISKP